MTPVALAQKLYTETACCARCPTPHRRRLQMSGEKKYYLTNLLAKTDLRTLAPTIEAPWICESGSLATERRTRSYHFEGRSWQGLRKSRSWRPSSRGCQWELCSKVVSVTSCSSSAITALTETGAKGIVLLRVTLGQFTDGLEMPWPLERSWGQESREGVWESSDSE
jgi:hypothetical protein